MDRRHLVSNRAAFAPKAAGLAVVALAVVLAAVAVGPATVTDGDVRGQDPAQNATDPWVAVDTVAVTDSAAVVVTFSTSANGTQQFRADGVDPRLASASENWAYLRGSAVPPALRRAAGNYSAGVAAVGPWVLVGDLAAASERVGNASVTVVAPAGVDVDPTRKAGFLARFLAPYSLQPTADDRVTLLVAPDALPADGLMYGDTGYVTQHAFWDGDVSSVWIHEYVHAQQNFELEAEMRWFREASATYLSYRVLEEQYEAVTEADVRERLAAGSEYAGIALANRSAWEGSHADYHRGTKLLYAVDAAVRTGSGGEHTIVDVFRAMNRHSGRVSVAEFVAVVERLAGDGQGWLADAITEPGDLDERVTRAGDAFRD